MKNISACERSSEATDIGRAGEIDDQRQGGSGRMLKSGLDVRAVGPTDSFVVVVECAADPTL